jgi:hypothetical protein
MFEEAGYNYQSIEIGKLYNIEDKDIFVKSYSHGDNCKENRKVMSIIRKEDSPVFHIIDDSGNILLKCTYNHRIFDTKQEDYVFIGDVEEGFLLNNNLEEVHFNVIETKMISPILDIQVEGNENYFTNGILSHNTTPGGNAPKFYSSIRLDVRRASIDNDGKDSDEDARGIRARVKNIKNKTSIPYRKGELYFSFTEGIAIHEEYLNFAVSYGFIEKKGAWYSCGEERVGQGKDNSVKYLKENPEFFEDIKRKVDERLQGNPAEKITLEVSPAAEEIEKPKRKKKDEDIISIASEALSVGE